MSGAALQGSSLIRTALLRPFRAYERSIDKYPIITKCILGGTLGGVGDLIIQWQVNEKLDRQRLAAFSATNAIISGGFNHVWFQWLETSAKTVLHKVAWQHLFFNPVIYLPAFYFMVGSMTGNHPSVTLAKLRAEFFRTYTMLLATWVPVNVLQFSVIPVAHQVLFVSGVNVGWNALLSCATMESPQEAAAAVEYNEKETTDGADGTVTAPVAA